MLKFFYSTFIFLLISVHLFGQEDSIKSLKETLEHAPDDSIRVVTCIDLHNALFKSNPSECLKYTLLMAKYASAMGSMQYLQKAYSGLARCYRKAKNYTEVLHYDSLSLSYGNKLNNNELLFSLQLMFAKDNLDAENNDHVYQWLHTSFLTLQKINDPAQEAKWNQTTGYYFNQINQHSQAIPYYYKAIHAFKKENDQYNLATTNVFLAETYIDLGKRDSVPALLFEALDIYSKGNNQSRMAYAHELLGEVYYGNGDGNKGIEHYKEARKLYAVSNNKTEEGLCLPNLAKGYIMKKDYATALDYIKQAQELFDTMKYEYGKIMLQTLWGQYYSEMGKPDVAEANFIKASELLKDKGYPELRTENEKYWSQNKYRMKQFIQADSLSYSYTAREANSEEPAVLAKELNMIKQRNKNLDSNSIKFLSVLYTPGGAELLKKELKNKSLYSVLHIDSITSLSPFSHANTDYDSAMTSSYNNQMLILETQFKTRQKDDSLQIANQNAVVSSAIIRKQNIFIAAAVVIAALLAIGFWLQYKNRKRAVRDKNKIELLQNEIHHRVKNNLGIIKRFAEVAEESGATSLSLSSLQNRITAIELLHKSLYQSKNNGQVSLQQYFEQLAKFISASFYEDDKSIAINIHAPVITDMQTAEKTGLIINELMTNSFKYGFANKVTGIISIEAKKTKNKKFTLSYDEDGIGFNKPDIIEGYGSRLIQGIANELNALVEIKTDNGIQFKMTV